MDGIIKKNSVVIFRDNNKEKKLELGSAMPVSKGDIISLSGRELSGKYEMTEKKIDYKIEGEKHNLLITYIFEKTN
jgi:hypothetical protein